MEAYRSYKTLQDNFLSVLLPKLHDGVAHTTYSLHATTTGRPNSKDLNLLNFPREPLVKQCIIARPNHKFVYADESQLDVRISAVVYDEPLLLEIVNDFSKDTHSYITAKAFNRNYDEIYNGYKNKVPDIVEVRVAGKTVQFGIIYGEGAQSLSYQLGIAEQQAQKFIDDYFKNFPNMKKNIDATIDKVIPLKRE